MGRLMSDLEKILDKYGKSIDDVDERIERLQEDFGNPMIFDDDRVFVEVLLETLLTLKERLEDK